MLTPITIQYHKMGLQGPSFALHPERNKIMASIPLGMEGGVRTTREGYCTVVRIQVLDQTLVSKHQLGIKDKKERKNTHT